MKTKLFQRMLTFGRDCSRSAERANSLCSCSFTALAAILICGASVFTSCTSKDDNPAAPVQPDLNLAENIIGKWVLADLDGQPALTNLKTVFTFVSPTKAYQCASFEELPDGSSTWVDYADVDVAIDGNKVTLNILSSDEKKVVDVLTISDINDKEMKAYLKGSFTINGEELYTVEKPVRFEKVPVDYSVDVLGLWECTDLSGIETFNDANARLEFMMNNTYSYCRLDTDGEWKMVKTREFQDYFVDGTLLATRWKDAGENELREWWEIASMSDEEMVWKALRQNEDGTTTEQEMRWKRVEWDVEPYIVGKWLTTEINGQPVLTNQKRVYTFTSPTQAYFSFSSDFIPGFEGESVWADHTDVEVDIVSTYMTLTHPLTDQIKTVEGFFFSHINAYEFTADHIISIQQGGKALYSASGFISFEKLTADYSADLIGLWECTSLSGIETYNDANARLEFFADGTYKYWRADDSGDWTAVTTREFQNYFVDGSLLCTRWKNQGDAELREWWEIASISGGEMVWKALRQNEDGTTVEQQATWKKAE